MARAEHDREDLLREATALVERVELQVEGFTEPVIAGFRRDGSLSLFFGSEPVYQFNSAGELRRAFLGGKMYKAEQGKLIELVRKRSPTVTELRSTNLSDGEQAELLTNAGNVLDRLRRAIARERHQIVGQLPPGADVVGRLVRALSALPDPLTIAQRPNAG